jgi:Ni/Fe-hydrogenase subunit HybB-like protein
MSDRARIVKDMHWFFIFSGAVAIIFRLWYGLGATTNLTDAVPWGLWKILNMVAGVALSTGGFTVGLLVYVLGVRQLQPLVRPAILIAFLGYGSSVFALALDIGLPHRIWHPIVMWNPRSFLFEVAMCVMTYFAITAAEMAPAVAERTPSLRRVGEVLHRAAAPMVIVGITLSSLHHTSLGSLFLVTPERLHPLWYTGWLPVLFITSAMGAGMMVTVLARIVWAYLYNPAPVFGAEASSCRACAAERSEPRAPEMARLQTLACVATGVLLLHLALKVADLARTGAWHYLAAGTWEAWLYTAELLLVAVAPAAIMAVARLRHSAWGLAAASACAVAGLALGRLNVGVFGYLGGAASGYVPAAAEWALCLGVIAGALLLFLLLSEWFPIFADDPKALPCDRRTFVPRFDRLSGVSLHTLARPFNRVTMVAVATIPLAWVLLAPAAGDARRASAVQPPRALDSQRATLLIDGNAHALAVAFPHLEHRRRLGGEESCTRCHHLSLPADHATPCSRCHRAMHASSDLFDHTEHITRVAEKERPGGRIPENRACRACHPSDAVKGAKTAKPCLDCHRANMRPSQRFGDARTLHPAVAYRAVFHGLCVPCHTSEGKRLERPTLGECATCHPRKPPAAGPGEEPARQARDGAATNRREESTGVRGG